MRFFMSQEKMHMKKLKELIRLSNEAKLTNRDLAKILHVSAGTISYYLRAIKLSGVTWPLEPSLTDSKLIELVEPYCRQIKNTRSFKEEPCWKTIHKEMSHKHMTIQLVYQEYQEKNPTIRYSYSNFCRKYKQWRKKQKITMPIAHEYGDKCFIDYAGDTIPIYSKNNQVIHNAQIFVAVLGGSQYIFITATLSQTIPDWIAANVKAFEFFGGVPALLVPDNLAAAVKDSCKYDPVANPAYTELAAHYNTAILPARAYRPKDKASAENSVLIAERWIMARLRKHKFYSLQALNNKIAELNIALNNKPFQKKDGSRTSLFIKYEQNKLRPIPKYRYEFAFFKTLIVQPNYHVSINNHFYSVPYQLVNTQVEARITNNTIEIIYDGQRVATHFINKTKGGRTTLDAHMPEYHREHKNWTEENFLQWANKIGGSVYSLSAAVINQNRHKDKNYRFHLGLRHLEKKYSAARLASACSLALSISSLNYKSISSILSKKLDLQPNELLNQQANSEPIMHTNIRGKNYFKQITEIQ